MSCRIELLKPAELERAFTIIEECKRALREASVFQWTDTYPSKETILTDIKKGHLFGLYIDKVCQAIIALNADQDLQYKAINWEDTQVNVMVLHRLAVDPTVQKQGIGGKLVDFAENYARSNNFSSIRLDAYSGNKTVLNFYEQRNYVIKGEVFFAGRDLPFFCFEKKLSNVED